jgi:tetratricopeptide (TPR) repeat protein/predicted Ser/Thr protein kinase
MNAGKMAHYEILDLLGEGGMGKVFRARDTQADRIVALKVLSGGAFTAEEIRRRFHREASAGMRLTHPNIVKIFEVGEEEGQFFISMEFVEGKTLRQLLRQRPLKPQEVIDIGIKVCEALKEAHEMGIVHRDIKSDNIMVTAAGDVKVMDFGIAKVQDASILTQEGTVLGTASYMSPEQAIGEVVDQRSDIFSLGVVLFEALTAQLPFPGDYELAVIYSIVNLEPVDIRELTKDVPEPLEQVIAKALRKELQQRYQSVEEMMRDLTKVKAFLEGRPGTVRTPPKLIATADWRKAEDKGIEFTRGIRRGFEARLAGRDEEFEILKKLFGRAAQGKGQTVFIAGEAGVGKTRLVLELEKYARTMKVRTLVGRCPFRQGVYPYQPFVEAIRGYFEFEGVTTGKKLEEFIQRRAPELTDQLAVIRVFLNITGKENFNIESKEQLWDAISRLIVRISQERPFILFIDDLHWADENTLDLLRYSSRNTLTSRLMILGTYRPDDARATAEGHVHPLLEIQRDLSQEEILTIIKLERLKETDIQQMVYSLFQDSDFGAPFYESLYKETEGNPFFVMETLKLMKVEGIIEKEDGGYRLKEDYERITIPSKIHDIVMRRIERLSQDQREMLEIGAVEGEGFHSDTIGNCLGINRIELLRKLQSLEREHHIIYPREKMYYFDHGKIREFLYDAIIPELRTEYHLMIGDHLARTYREDQRLAPAIAHHFLEAEAKQRALPFLVTAGERARAVFANSQAIEFYDKSLEIIRNPEENAIGVDTSKFQSTALEGLGDILALTGRHDDSLANYRELKSITSSSSPRQVELLWKLGAVHLSKGENEKALEFLDQAEIEYEKTLKSLGDDSQLHEIGNEEFDLRALFGTFGKIKFSRARVLKAIGNYGEAKREIENGLKILEDEGNLREKGQAYNDLGNILFDQGDYGQAEMVYKTGLELRKKIADKKGIAETYNNLGIVYIEQGNYTNAAEMMEMCVETMKEIGFREGIAGTLTNLGAIYYDQGRYQESFELHQQSLAISQDMRNVPGMIISYANLGPVAIELENYPLAVEHLEECLRLSEDSNIIIHQPQAYVWLGKAYSELDRYEDARRLAFRALDLSTELNQKPSLGFAKRIIGVVETNQLKSEKDPVKINEMRDVIEVYMSGSLDIFRELKMEHEFGRTYLELVKYYLTIGDEVKRKECAERAKEIFQKVGAMGDLKKIEKLESN